MARVFVDTFNKGIALEREVAGIYRTLGAKVEHEVAVAGNQIDVLVREKTTSGSEVTAAIECKSFTKPVGVEVVNSFGAVTYLLKQRSLIDRAVLVATNGFTKQARVAAKEHSIELLELADLKARVRGKERTLGTQIKYVERAYIKAQKSPQRPKKVFAVMPFAKEFEDIYILGIRAVAEKLQLVVQRGDDIEHNQDIISIIQQSIKNSDLVVADTTHQNPNVFYEIGYSHAIPVETILITRKNESIPFDLRAKNHIFYETIVDLKDRLEKRICAVLHIQPPGN